MVDVACGNVIGVVNNGFLAQPENTILNILTPTYNTHQKVLIRLNLFYIANTANKNAAVLSQNAKSV